MSNAIFKLENHYVNYNELRSYDGDDIEEVVQYIKHLEQRLAEVEERLSDAQGVFHSGQFFSAEEMLAHVQAKLFNEDYAPPANEV